jgi:predicted nucleic acid-binding protein
MLKIVFDSCVLSNFALTGSFSIIRTLYPGTAAVTDFVNAEITKGLQLRHAKLIEIKSAIQQGLIEEISLVSPKEKALFENLSTSLGCGEASSIAAAKERNLIFASDDKVARREAVRLGVKLTGTLGILKKAVTAKIISAKEADAILNKMTATGFYSPIKSIKEIR